MFLCLSLWFHCSHRGPLQSVGSARTEVLLSQAGGLAGEEPVPERAGRQCPDRRAEGQADGKQRHCLRQTLAAARQKDSALQQRTRPPKPRSARSARARTCTTPATAAAAAAGRSAAGTAGPAPRRSGRGRRRPPCSPGPSAARPFGATSVWCNKCLCLFGSGRLRANSRDRSQSHGCCRPTAAALSLSLSHLVNVQDEGLRVIR
eukprot:SAG22_NODE_1350_length_4653_cov_2.908652_2_plen_205_part_00